MKIVRILVVVVPLLGSCLALALAVSALLIGSPWWSSLLLWVSCALLVVACIKVFGSHIYTAFADQYQQEGLEANVDRAWIQRSLNLGIWLTIAGLGCFLIGWVSGGSELTRALLQMIMS